MELQTIPHMKLSPDNAAEQYLVRGTRTFYRPDLLFWKFIAAIEAILLVDDDTAHALAEFERFFLPNGC